MRRLTAALSLVLLAALALPAQAAEVAVLDWRRALMQTDAAQRSMSELESRIGSQQRQAQALDQELSQLQQRASSLTDSERQEANRKASELNRLVGEMMQAQQEAEQRFLSNAESRLEQAVEQVIARHGIDVLVEPQGVLHANQDLPDLTGEVTQILNSLF
ncbi:OmpH family outer membrane protein [Halomonas sp. A11-A]|uniref:OmpH family outer membrane protein n=1 Tax=Halomonas sp. A11-A TaxID=2183985 RepID=UPI000D71B28B|nr:OmpH family outer membrane protein [Halomonas sp. A11-A]PWV79866.1 periplasmic chaperone for outer membrane proteins Skp [Halomonas sp. A11-A]